MGKRHTTEQFIEKARKVHGGKYDYSKVEYIDRTTKINIICNDHGLFQQRPFLHLRGNGCPRCGVVNKQKTLRDFIERANNVHQFKYSYEAAVYKNTFTKITIICPIHGDFEQTPTSHMQGAGCPNCSKNQIKTNAEFIADAKRVHGDLYLYEKVKYINAHTNITITCRVHGDFEQTPSNHLQGRGCVKCNAKQFINDLETFILHANIRHNNFYSYNKSVYINTHTKLIITCPIHGDFEQTPSNHLKGQGCSTCNKRYSGVYSELYFENNPDIREVPSIVYIIRHNKYIKIGITKRSINQRFPRIKKGDVLYTHKTTLYQAYQIEQHILKKFDRYRIQTIDDKFDGWTECFENINTNDLIEQIKIWERSTRQSNL